MLLNTQQKEARDLILRVKSNVFLSGFAGTGKTLLLRSLIKSLREEKKQVRVCAFTGLAAQHLQGTTIAKLLGLGLCRRVEDMHRVELDRTIKNLDGVSHIVIDEISMVSGDYLELIDEVCQYATGNPEPFGGIRMIFGGDFMQLPPIQTEKEVPAKMPWAFEYGPFQETIALFLTQSHRQTDDGELELLNEFRQGIISPAGRKFLDEAIDRPLENPVSLYPYRKNVEQMNQDHLTKHPGKLYTYQTKGTPWDKEDMLLQNVPVGKKVELKEGVPVIVLTNDPGGKFVNGSQGIVRTLFDASATIELNNGHTITVHPRVWEILNPEGKPLGTVRGMPLALGWAATIHRAQGMTLDAVSTDIARCWEPGQAYVALSRTRSLTGISLCSKVEQIKADPVALSYVNNLF